MSVSSSNNIIPIFVISLPDSADRRETIKATLDALSLPFEYVDAIDGRHGLSREHEALVDRDGATAFTSHPLTDAEFACALSHIEAYRAVVDRAIPFALILEDDAIPQPALPKFLEGRHFDEADLTSLCYSRAYIRPKTATHLFGEHKSYRCEPGIPVPEAVGYIVSLAAARHLLKCALPVAGVADWPACTEIFKARNRWRLVHPRLVDHATRKDDGIPSIIKPTRVDRKRRFLGVYIPPWEKVWRSCKWRLSYRFRGFRRINL